MPFRDFTPQIVDHGRYKKHLLETNHGITSSYTLRDLSQAKDITLESTVIDYQINGNTYPLCTVADLFTTSYHVMNASEGNIRGMLGERIARRMTKRFLQNYSDHGRIGGLFRKEFKAEQYVIANTDKHILKIIDYPNCI